jgi:hypothetical protein
VTDLSRPVVRRSFPAHAVFVLASAAAVVLAWMAVAATARGVRGILRFVIPGGVQ